MAHVLDMQKLGGDVLRSAIHAKGIYDLLVASFMRVSALLNPMTRKVLNRQIYFTGVQAVGSISFISALIGIAIITQASSIVGTNPLLIGKILVWAVVRELGPLLAAIIIVARSSTAVASELGSMKVGREVDRLLTMGIDPINYLIVPRVVGTSLCVVVLTFYFQVVAITGGLVLSTVFMETRVMQSIGGIFSVLTLFDMVVSVLKSFVFGLVIATVSCYHGLRVRSSITEIPQMTSYAVMQSLFMIFLFNGMITVLSFIW